MLKPLSVMTLSVTNMRVVWGRGWAATLGEADTPHCRGKDTDLEPEPPITWGLLLQTGLTGWGRMFGPSGYWAVDLQPVEVAVLALSLLHVVPRGGQHHRGVPGGGVLVGPPDHIGECSGTGNVSIDSGHSLSPLGFCLFVWIAGWLTG